MHRLAFALTISLTLFASASDPQELYIPESISEQFETFEPSAGVYLRDLDQYLIASDDTDKKDRPFLFLMNHQGELADKPIPVKGLSKMTDIESISQDASGALYLLSSLGLNKNGKEKPERNILARAVRKGTDINVTHSIYLRPLLLEALENSDDPILKTLSEDYENDLDVEASFIDNGNLYLGLKNPQPNAGKGLILNVGSVDFLFENEALSSVSLWKTIPFATLSDDADLISDMVLSGDTLFMTTTTEEGAGRFWKYSISRAELSLVEHFPNHKPEGIVLHPAKSEILLLFDQGDENALYSFSR